MTEKRIVERKFCNCCGVQRDVDGFMRHDEECLWHGVTDGDWKDERGERTLIWCPYIPNDLGVW